MPQRAEAVVLQNDRLLDIKALAYMLGIHQKNIRNMIGNGALPAPGKVGEYERWRYGDIQMWLRPIIKIDRPVEMANVTVDDVPSELDIVRGQLGEFRFLIPPCVYFLMKGTIVIYVGMTENLNARVEQHRRGDQRNPPKDFDRVLYLVTAHGQLPIVERYWIRTLRPYWNVTCNPLGPEGGFDGPGGSSEPDPSDVGNVI